MVYENLVTYYEEMKKRKVFVQSDNDGCILLTEENLHYPAWWKYGIMSYTEMAGNSPKRFLEWVEMCRGRKTPDNILRALKEFGTAEMQGKSLDPEWIEKESRKKEKMVEDFLPEDCPFNEGAKETLELWNTVNLPWGITTSAGEFKKIYLPKYPEFSSLIDQEVAVTPDMIRRGKPHPEPFLTGAKLVKEKFLLPEESIMIGIEDAYSGIVALIRANADIIVVIGSAISTADRKALAKIHPNILYAKTYKVFLDEKFLSELVGIIKRI